MGSLGMVDKSTETTDEVKMRKSDRLKLDKDSSPEHDEISIKLYQKFKEPEFAKRFAPSADAIFEKATLEYALRNNSRIVGFIDLLVQYKDPSDGMTFRDVIFEVKTSVSIGEVLRQLRFYRFNADNRVGGQWLCAPACEHIEILKDHGINFLDSNTL